MIDNLLKNTSFLLASQIFIMLIGLLSQIIMARLLMPEGRGVYALCIVYSSFVILFTNFGNEFGIRFLLLKKKLNLSDSFMFLIITTVTSIGISFLILSILYTYFNIRIFNKVTADQLLLALIFTVSNIISKQTNVLLTISKEFKKAAFISFFEEAIKLILLFVFLRVFKSVEMALTSVIFGNIIIIIYYFVRFKLYKIDIRNLSFKNLCYIYKYGLRNFFFSFSNLANGHLSIIILGIYLSNEKIGVYSVAFGLISRLQFIPDTLNRIFVPLSTENHQAENVYLKLFSSFLFYLFLVILVFLIIFGNQIVLLLFGVAYIEAGIIVKILSVGFVFKMLAKPIEAYYNEVKGKPEVISIINGISLVCLSIFMLIMSKNYGIIGASIASSVIMTLSYLVLFKVFLITERDSIVGFFDFKKLLNYFKDSYNGKNAN